MSYGSIEFYLFLLVGILSGSSFGLLLESLYYLIRNKKEFKKRIIWSFVFLVVFILSEVYLFTLIKETFFRFPECDDWLCPLYMSYLPFGTHIQFLLGYNLLGLFVYSLLQIPYGMYWYIRKDKERGERAIKRFIIFFALCILVFIIFRGYIKVI